MTQAIEAPTAGQLGALTGLRKRAAQLFPTGVQQAMRTVPLRHEPAPISELHELAWQHFEALGFSCQRDLFDAIVPRSDELTLMAWSRAKRRYNGFDVTVIVRAFEFGGMVAIEFCSPTREPLPCSTTGYRSHFATFADLAEWPDLDAYLASWFPLTEAQKAGQLGLFR